MELIDKTLIWGLHAGNGYKLSIKELKIKLPSKLSHITEKQIEETLLWFEEELYLEEEYKAKFKQYYEEEQPIELVL